jgi:hypothetical protein
MSATRDELTILSEQLRTIAEQLSDLAMDQVRSAIHAEGDPQSEMSREAAKLERELLRARRAVENAAAILAASGGLDEGEDGD